MSIARHTAWTFVGVGGQQFARLLIVIILARLLTPHEFGVVAGAQIFISLAEALVNFGIGTALVQAKELDREIERGAMTVVALTSAIVALALVAAAPAMAASIAIPEVALTLPWLAFGLFLQGLTGPIFQLMFREFRFSGVAAVQLTSYALGYGAVAIALAFAGASYWAIVFGSLAQAVMQFVFAFSLRPVGFTLRPAWGRLRHVLHYGGGVLVSSILNTVARKADNWVAGRMLGASALSFYGRAYALVDMANQVPGVILGRVLLPYFARHAHSEGKSAIARRQFLLSHVAAAALSLPAAIATVLLAPEIVRLLLGRQWLPVAPVLAILGYGMFFRLGYKVSGTVNVAYGGVWQAVLRHGVYAIIVTVGSLIGATYGLKGIAWAVLIALGWQFWALTNLALRAVGGTWTALALSLVPVTIASAAAAAGGILVDATLANGAGPWGRAVLIGSGIALPYFASLWLLRRTSEIDQLLRLSASLLQRQRPSGELKESVDQQ